MVFSTPCSAPQQWYTLFGPGAPLAAWMWLAILAKKRVNFLNSSENCYKAMCSATVDASDSLCQATSYSAWVLRFARRWRACDSPSPNADVEHDTVLINFPSQMHACLVNFCWKPSEPWLALQFHCKCLQGAEQGHIDTCPSSSYSMSLGSTTLLEWSR